MTRHRRRLARSDFTDATASCRAGTPFSVTCTLLSAVIEVCSASTEVQTPDASPLADELASPLAEELAGRAGGRLADELAEEVAVGLSDEQPTINAARTRAGSAASEASHGVHADRGRDHRDPSVRVNERAGCASGDLVGR